MISEASGAAAIDVDIRAVLHQGDRSAVIVAGAVISLPCSCWHGPPYFTNSESSGTKVALAGRFIGANGEDGGGIAPVELYNAPAPAGE